CARYLPVLSMRHFRLMNLRLHRKALIVDGATVFTGGMNIREGHDLTRVPHSSQAIRDVCFKIEGPVVASLMDVFAEDWWFTTGERLQGEDWFPQLTPMGNVVLRSVPDGPDKYFENTRLILYGAIANAREKL